eukprot:Polyplicarium_translucidae@DN2253_c0_g1_i1.p1
MSLQGNENLKLSKNLSTGFLALKLHQSHVRCTEQNSCGAVFVCGSPGTGKTSCIAQIVDGLRESTNVIEMNALGVGDPSEALVQIGEKLGCKGLRRKSASQVSRTDEALASSGCGCDYRRAKTRTDQVGCRAPRLGGGNSTVVVVDEADQLGPVASTQGFRRTPARKAASRQPTDILFQLFRMSLTPSSRLVLIAIANAVDVGASLLESLRSDAAVDVSAFNSVVFQPYSADQLRSILLHRLSAGSRESLGIPGAAPGGRLIDRAAVELCVRKVASVSGDCRQSLDACRRLLNEKRAARRKTCRREPNTPNGKQKRPKFAGTPSPRHADCGRGGLLSPLTATTASAGTTPSRDEVDSPTEDRVAPIGIHDMKDVIHCQFGTIRDRFRATMARLPLHQQLLLCAACVVVRADSHGGDDKPVSALQEQYEQICASRGITKQFTTGGISIAEGLQALNQAGLIEFTMAQRGCTPAKKRPNKRGWPCGSFRLAASAVQVEGAVADLRNGCLRAVLQ